jgi:glyceraldehyde 3-phosphate dehydrogenase
MTIRLGINGFGRIGRAILRKSLLTPEVEVVHINDLVTPQTLGHLIKYDSVHSTLQEKVIVEGNSLNIKGKQISISNSKSPAEIPWKDKQVDIVLECTGFFTKKEDCLLHIKAGAKKVLLSAPGKGEDLTVVYGVNHNLLSDKHTVVSNGSCTTNCLAPPTKVIHEKFKIISGLMTTVHSYTNDQRILDLPHSDLRRARAAATNIIPTTTGAAKAIGLVLPELKGKIDGIAVRVPTPNVSLVDATYWVEKKTTASAINELLQEASKQELKGILQCQNLPLVSSDFNGNPHSSIIDLAMTKVINHQMIKFISWYDNETGFSSRMLDVAKIMANV